jgi:hypothetical protein
MTGKVVAGMAEANKSIGKRTMKASALNVLATAGKLSRRKFAVP